MVLKTVPVVGHYGNLTSVDEAKNTLGHDSEDGHETLVPYGSVEEAIVEIVTEVVKGEIANC